MNTLLLTRADPNQGCTKATCPASASIYGYAPNLPATLFFLTLFTLSGLTHLLQYLLLHRHTPFFTAAMLLGALSESLGYVAKLLLHQNPFSDTGFKMSVVLLTFAPAFYAAGIYYTLKHICLAFATTQSRLQPSLYTWIFISCDLFSILLQAIGGAISSATHDLHVLDIGTNVMIAGLVTQVATLVVFGLLAADYGLAVYRSGKKASTGTPFLCALWVAFLGILVRCCYRVAELVGGWTGNAVLRDEGLFVALDSVPIALAAVVLNLWHPGRCLPQLREEKEGGGV